MSNPFESLARYKMDVARQNAARQQQQFAQQQQQIAQQRLAQQQQLRQQQQQFTQQGVTRQRGFEDQAREAMLSGDTAAMEHLRSRVQPPQVRGGMTTPPPMTLEGVTQSIMKNNPNISPQALFSALDKFKPMLAQADKIRLAQVQKQSASNIIEGKNIAGDLYRDAIKRGKSPTEAAAEAAKYKRAGAGEVKDVGRAKIELGREERFTKTEATLVSFENASLIVEDTIGKALETMSPWSAGYGSLLSFLPESEARKLKGYLDTIKANIGFDKLQNMRENSPTGGALGQVSNFENELLQATMGALDPAQSDLLRENLQKIQKFYPLFLEERRRAFNQDYSKARPRDAIPPPSRESKRARLNTPEQPPSVGALPTGWSVTEVR